jgi:hypothetical protein
MKNELERNNLKLKYSKCNLPTRKKWSKCPSSLMPGDADDSSFEEKKTKKLVEYYNLQKMILWKERVSKLT